MTKVLLTGFDPFGGEQINPSWEAVQRIATSEEIKGIEISGLQIPTSFTQSFTVLRQAIMEHQPDVVICVGQAGGRMKITPERVAINIQDASIPDNDGHTPIDVPIVLNGPAAYWSTLPVKDMVLNIQDDGIEAGLSNSAGTYVCNSLFYHLMHLVATDCKAVMGGFIHIPYLPEQVIDRDLPSMSLSDIIRGLKIAVEVAALSHQEQRGIANT